MQSALSAGESIEKWKYPNFATYKRSQFEENTVVYEDDLTRGTGLEFVMKGVYIWYGRFRANVGKQILVSSWNSHIQMNFNLQNVTSYFSESLGKPFFKLKSHQHNILVLPKRNIIVQWQPYEETETFSINLTPEFFFDNLPEEHPLCRHFQKGLDATTPVFLSDWNLPITSRMISILYELIHCPSEGYLKNLFFKSRIIELLALQLEQSGQDFPVTKPLLLKSVESDKMLIAREILIENMESPLSLKDLAHRVGTNEFNLKRDFKIMFGKTVFGYLNDFRMERAKELLANEPKRISEVAHSLGYKHATHFTAAFKKHFGYLPTQVRLVLLHLLQFAEYLAETFLELAETTTITEVIPV